MPTILCFGDSNTWGAVPMTSWTDRRRFGPADRWTGVMQARLGPAWNVVAEGLPGRTTVLDDPVDGAYLSGLRAIRACLESHRPLDHVVLMLGTNDLKRRFGVEAEEVAAGIDRLLWEVRHLECLDGVAPRVLLVSPVPVTATGIFTQMFAGAERKSRDLAPLLRQLAADRDVDFLDAGEVAATSPIDGIHLEAASHRVLGEAVARCFM